jgi:tRNA(Arg) A34 adenosine deaminase TadA
MEVNMASTESLTQLDRDRLETAIAVSMSARAHGNHPFGAILTNREGRTVLESENTVVTDRDATGHAETNLVRLATKQFDTSELAEHTLYTSCEPCAMCSGAIYWAGIGRVVYGMSETDLIELTGSSPQNPTLALPCRTIFAAGQRQISVSGPWLESEALKAHLGFWR